MFKQLSRLGYHTPCNYWVIIGSLFVIMPTLHAHNNVITIDIHVHVFHTVFCLWLHFNILKYSVHVHVLKLYDHNF